MPLKEYRCKAHGPYDAYSAVCPHGCPERFSVQEIRTAPAFGSNMTRATDGIVRDLATSYGLRDIKTDKAGGTSVMDEIRKGQNFSPRWGPQSGEVAGSLALAGVAGSQNNMAPGVTDHAKRRLQYTAMTKSKHAHTL